MFGVAEANHNETLIWRRDVARDKRIGSIDRRHTLEVDVSARELWRDVVHVIVHAAQDSIGHRFCRVAALGAIAVNFLDPLKVNNRHDADQQVDIFGHVHCVGYHTTM